MFWKGHSQCRTQKLVQNPCPGLGCAQNCSTTRHVVFLNDGFTMIYMEIYHDLPGILGHLKLQPSNTAPLQDPGVPSAFGFAHELRLQSRSCNCPLAADFQDGSGPTSVIDRTNKWIQMATSTSGIVFQPHKLWVRC